MITKITDKSGTEVTVNTAAFFHAIGKSASAVNDTVMIAGVPYTLSTARFILTGGSTVIGSIDCSTNPNYPLASAGDIYRGSVAGNIGGVSGKPVSKYDLIMCIVSAAAGNEAAVGSSWVVIPTKIDNSAFIHVDANNGSDTMGRKYDPQRPFATITAAEAVAVAGDVINILPGTYTTNGHGAAGGTFICSEGVIFNSAVGTGATFDCSTPALNLKVVGHAKFIGTDRALTFDSTGGNIYFEFDTLIQTNPSIIYISNYDTCYVSGNEVIHTNTGGGSINGPISITSNASTTSNGYVNIHKLQSDAQIGAFTVIEMKGQLYAKIDQIIGSPITGGGTVLVLVSGAAGVDFHLDSEYIENATVTGAGSVSHGIYIDAAKGTSRINCKYVLNSNGFDGSAGLTNNNSLGTYFNGDLVDSNAMAIIMVDGVLKAKGIFQHRGGLVLETIRHTAGSLKLSDAYVKNYTANAAAYGVTKAGGTLILDDVTIVTDAASDSIYAGAAQNVKIYSLYANKAMNVNITDLVGGTLIVDADVE